MADSNAGFIYLIISIFIFLGVITPYINAEFGSDTQIDASDFEDTISQGDVSATDVALSIFSMFFWTFGALPWYIDMVLLVFRIMLAYLIWEAVWI